MVGAETSPMAQVLKVWAVGCSTHGSSTAFKRDYGRKVGHGGVCLWRDVGTLTSSASLSLASRPP